MVLLHAQIPSRSLNCDHRPILDFNADIVLPSYVSPRHRAQRTLELLDIGCRDKLPWQDCRNQASDVRTDAKIQITEDIREWDYGEYEGITSAEIKEKRKQQGLPEWDIWRDGCPGGE